MQQQPGHSRFFRIAITILIVFMVIFLFRSGYHTGQWLYRFTH